MQAFSASQTWQADALIGADGLWSEVRQDLLKDGAPRVSGHLAWRAMLRQADLPAALRSQCVTVWLGPRMHAVQYPVRRGEWLNLIVVTEGAPPENPHGWDHQANAYELMARMGGACAPLRDLTTRSEERRVGKECRSRWSPYH